MELAALDMETRERDRVSRDTDKASERKENFFLLFYLRQRDSVAVMVEEVYRAQPIPSSAVLGHISDRSDRILLGFYF